MASSFLCNSDRHKASYLALVKNHQTILATAIHIRDRQLLLSKSTNLKAVELIAKDLAINPPSIENSIRVIVV